MLESGEGPPLVRHLHLPDCMLKKRQDITLIAASIRSQTARLLAQKTRGTLVMIGWLFFGKRAGAKEGNIQLDALPWVMRCICLRMVTRTRGGMDSSAVWGWRKQITRKRPQATPYWWSKVPMAALNPAKAWCQRQSKSEPKGSAKCCHFGVGMNAA